MRKEGRQGGRVSNSACLHFSPKLSELMGSFFSQADILATAFFLTSQGSPGKGQLPKTFGKNSNRPWEKRREGPGDE